MPVAFELRGHQTNSFYPCYNYYILYKACMYICIFMSYVRMYVLKYVLDDNICMFLCFVLNYKGWKLCTYVPLLLCSYLCTYTYICMHIYLCYLAFKSLNSRSAQSWIISDMSFMVNQMFVKVTVQISIN